MTVVAVVIPYYQKTPGLLRRALTSVLRQHLPPNVRVDIALADDGSPVPARTEIEGLDIALPFQLRLAEQPNSGVAAARNKALGLVTGDATYIALLDSDDIWEPDHLARAIAALNRGYDFYFANSKRIEWSKTTFARNWFNDFLQQHGKSLGDDFYEIKRADFFDRALLHRPFHTPAAVYRRSTADAITFDTALRSVGEDCLFFFQVIQKCNRICCGTKVTLHIAADAVNIHASAHSWDSPARLAREMGQIIAYYKFKERLALSPENRRSVTGKINSLRASLAFLTLRYVLKNRQAWPRELTAMTRRDPTFWLWYPAWALYVTAAYPLRFYDPLKAERHLAETA
jgi:succinoglycan biosynthesis protein ExoW